MHDEAPLLSRRRALLLGGGGALALLVAGCDDDAKPVLLGRRENVLSTGAGLVVDSADTTKISLPAPVAVSEWTQPGRIPSHEALNIAVGDNALELRRPLWRDSIGTGAGSRGALSAEPVVADGHVFTMDSRGVISCFDLQNGSRLWRTDIKPKKTRSSNVGGGLSYAEGVLYAVDGIAETLALEPTSGKILWRVDVGTPGRSAPTVVDGRLFVGTIDERLFALDVKNGKKLWVYQASAAATVVFGQPAPAVVGGTVIAGFGSGDIAALRAETGESIWSDTLGSSGTGNSIVDFVSIHGLPVISGGTAYAISVGRVLTALDVRSGRRLWERAVSGKDNLLIVGDFIFLLSEDQQLACLDKTNGHVLWVSDLPRFRRPKPQKGAITWTGPVLVNGKLVCFSDFPKQGMIAVDAVTGEVGKPVRMDQIAALPPVAVAGHMLVITEDGTLSVYG